MVFYEHEIRVDLQNVDKAATSDFPLANDDTFTSILMDHLAKEEVDEATHDDIGEVHLDCDVLDEPKYANDDNAPEHEKKAHEGGNPLVTLILDFENADNVKVRSLTRGHIPSKRYLSSTYI